MMMVRLIEHHYRSIDSHVDISDRREVLVKTESRGVAECGRSKVALPLF